MKISDRKNPKNEERLTLGDGVKFRLTLSNFGGAIVSWQTPEGKDICRKGPASGQAKSGRDHGGFFTISHFGRTKDRKVRCNGNEYTLPPVFPNNPAEEHALHGPEAHLLWDHVRYQLPNGDVDPNRIRFILPAEALPEGWPFPHDSHVDYLVNNDTMIVRVGLTNHWSESRPAFPVFHPFFRYKRDGQPIHLQTRLKSRFTIDDAELSLPYTFDKTMPGGGPYVKRDVLQPHENNSHRFDGLLQFGWRDAWFGLVTSCRFLHLWSELHDQGEHGVCGIEPGGIANAFHLRQYNSLTDDDLLIAKPGQTVEQIFVFTSLRW